MKTYTITEAQFKALTRMIDFAEYWLEDRENNGDGQWEIDNKKVNEAILVMAEIHKGEAYGI